MVPTVAASRVRRSSSAGSVPLCTLGHPVMRAASRASASTSTGGGSRPQRRGLEGAHQVVRSPNRRSTAKPEKKKMRKSVTIAEDAVAHHEALTGYSGQPVVGVFDRRHRAQGHAGGDQHGAGQVFSPGNAVMTGSANGVSKSPWQEEGVAAAVGAVFPAQAEDAQIHPGYRRPARARRLAWPTMCSVLDPPPVGSGAYGRWDGIARGLGLPAGGHAARS